MTRPLIRMVQAFRSMLLAGVFGASILHANLTPLPMSEPMQHGDRAQAENTSNQVSWDALVAKGRTLRDQSRYADAELCLRSAVSLAEEFGSTDPRYAESLNALATVVQIRGRYDEAESLFQQAVSIWRQHSAEHRLDLAVGLSNLANLLRVKGQYGEAEDRDLDIMMLMLKVEPLPDGLRAGLRLTASLRKMRLES